MAFPNSTSCDTKRDRGQSSLVGFFLIDGAPTKPQPGTERRAGKRERDNAASASLQGEGRSTYKTVSGVLDLVLDGSKRQVKWQKNEFGFRSPPSVGSAGHSPSLFFAVFNSDVHQVGVLWLLDGSKDERRVGGRILGFVSLDGIEFSRVGDDGGDLFELVELGSHDCLESGMFKCSLLHEEY